LTQLSRDSVLRDYINNLNKNSDKINTLLYKPAKIYTGGKDGTRSWFVFFYFRLAITDKFKRFPITGDINRIKDDATRLLSAKILQKTINEALKDGWNPHHDHTNKIAGESGRSLTDYYSVTAALEDTLKSVSKSKRPRTAATYASHLRMFIAWLTKENFHDLDINKISPVIIQKYTDYLQDLKQASVTINHKIEILSALFKRLKKLQVIKENPCEAIDKLSEEESTFFEPITDDEITAIAKHLKKVKPELFMFMLFIYYSLLRPLTIVQLKKEHLKFKERKIIIGGAMHKNRKKWIKQMLQPLHDYLLQYGYDKIPDDYYLFSNNLKPGKNLILPERAREFWNKHVVKDLGINKKMYAAKHTMGINYLNDNLGAEDMRWLQMQMAHSSLEETDNYLKSNTVKFLDESKSTIRKI
jgi:integrase